MDVKSLVKEERCRDNICLKEQKVKRKIRELKKRAVEKWESIGDLQKEQENVMEGCE